MDTSGLNQKILLKSKRQLSLKKFYNPYNGMSDEEVQKYNYPSKNDLVPQLPEIFFTKKGKKHGK